VTTDLISLPFTESTTAIASAGTYNNATGIWTIGDLTASSNATLQIFTTVDDGAPTGSPYTVTADATSTTDDPDISDNSSSTTVVVTPAADVTVGIAASTATVTETKAIDFTITVTNNDTTDIASSVSMTTNLPSLPFTDVTTPVESTGSYDAGTGFWAVGDLAAGASATLTFSTTANTGAATGSPYTATADVTSTNDDDSSNNSSSTIITVTPSADITTTYSASASTINNGESVTLTITVDNTDANDAENVRVQTNFTAFTTEFTIQSVTESQGSLDTGTDLWTVGTVAAGTSATLDVVLLSSATGIAGNDYTFTSNVISDNDSDNSNNTANTTVDVNPNVSVTIDYTITQSTITTGGFADLAIGVTNADPGTAAEDHEVTLNLSSFVPANFTIVSSTPTLGTYDGADTWAVGDLPQSSSASLSIRLQALNDSADDYTFTSNMTYSNDSGAGTNTASDTLTVIDPPTDLEMLVTVSDATLAEVETTIVSFRVNNTGADTAKNVSVNLSIPGAFTVTTNSITAGTTYNGTDTWTIGDIASSGNAVLNLNFTANVGSSGSTYPITAEVTSSNDPNAANDIASENIQVLQADLGVVVSINPVQDSYADNDIVTLTITVTNNGPNAVDSVIINDDFSNDLLQASIETPSQGTYNFSTGEWLLDPGFTGTATLQIPVEILTGSAGTTINATASVGSNPATDPDGANDSDTLAIPVADVDISYSLSFTPSIQLNNGPVQVDLTIANAGPDAATGVIGIDDIIGAGVFDDPGSPTPPQGSYDYNTGIWNVGTINGSDSITFTFNTTVTNSAPAFTSVDVDYDSSTDGTDTNPGNDSGTTNFTVGG